MSGPDSANVQDGSALERGDTGPTSLNNGARSSISGQNTKDDASEETLGEPKAVLRTFPSHAWPDG